MNSINQIPNQTRSLLRNRSMLIIFSITLSATMGVSLVTPVMPRLIDVFGISRQEVVLLVTAFTLPGVFIAPFYGIMADRWGRKKILVPALLLFGLAGAACGFATEFWVLLMFRFLQGMGGAALFTLNNTLIGDLFHGKVRFQAMGFNASVISLSAGVYPAFGGMLADIKWNFPFFVPVFALLVCIVVAIWLKNPEPAKMASIGNYLRAALDSMRQWQVIRLFILILITFILTFGPIISFVPFWMSEQYHSSTTAIGLILASASLTAGIVSARLGWIRRRFTVHSIIYTSFLFYALALWIIPHISWQWWMILPTMIFGLAQGLSLPTVQTLIVGAAPFQYRGAYMSINSTIILTGITVAPLLAALAFKTVGLINLYYLTGLAALIMSGLVFRFGRDLDREFNV